MNRRSANDLALVAILSGGALDLLDQETRRNDADEVAILTTVPMLYGLSMRSSNSTVERQCE